MFKSKVPPLAVKAWFAVPPLSILKPVAFTFPFTSNISDGKVVPIPTLLVVPFTTKAGVVIKEISGGTASFGVGLYKKDGTAVNAVGLVAAAAKTAGAVAGAGALLNTVLADDSYISVSSDTVSATKLRGFIYVEYV